MKRYQFLLAIDDTGSMRPCRHEVRRRTKAIVRAIKARFGDQAEIAIIIFGDYCDGRRALEVLDFTLDEDEIIAFLTNTPPKDGGDADEFYELVIHRARDLRWKKGADKSMLLFGDANPHGVDYEDNTLRLDWREEITAFVNETDAVLHMIQCLGRSGSTAFYREGARLGHGKHVPLDQLEDVEHVILGLAAFQAGQMDQFEAELRKARELTKSLERMIASITGRAPKAHRAYSHKLVPVSASRFQRFRDVPTDLTMREFIEEMGLTFYPKMGFYPLDARTETIQENKEIVLRHRITGEYFGGDGARELIGLPRGSRGRVRPNLLEDYIVFVRSDSPGNRKLRSTDTAELLWDMDAYEDRLEEARRKSSRKRKPAHA